MKLSNQVRHVSLLALLLSLILVVAVACANPAATPTPTQAPPTATAVPPTATPTARPATPTAVLPTATPTRVAIATPTAAPAATPTPTRVVAVPTATATRVPPTPTPAGEKPVRGGILSIALSQDVVRFDPHTAIGGPDIPLLGKIYNAVMNNPGGDTLECDLCEKFDISGDGKTITITLRKNVVFHNGQKMTAKDVEYSLNKIMGFVDNVPSPRVGLIRNGIDKIQVVDDYTLKLLLKRPTAALPTFLIFSGGALRMNPMSMAFSTLM